MRTTVHSIGDFELKMTELLEEFRDVPYEELSDSLEHFSTLCLNRIKKEGSK